MNNLLTWLQGKKTYVVALVSVVTGVSAYLKGKESLTTALTNVPGLMVYAGGLVASLRAGLARLQADVKTLVK